MPLPESLIKAALLGTAKQSIPPDVLNASLADEPPEAQLLLSAASFTLREKAGYMAGHNHRPLSETAPLEATSPCSDEAMGYLRLMLTGIHTYAIREWLIAAARARRHVQADGLPNMLLLGLKQKALRPYLLPVLGKRALWLALEINNQNWKWVFDTPDYAIDDVIAFDRFPEQEMIEKLREMALTQLTDELNVWSRYRLVWSQELMAAFFISLDKMKPPDPMYQWWSTYFLRGLIPYSYFFPLEHCAEFQRRIEASPIFGAHSAPLIESLQAITAFRRNMLQAFPESED